MASTSAGHSYSGTSEIWRARAGSFSPEPVMMQTAAFPFRSTRPVLVSLTSPATEAAEAGSQKMPSRCAMVL